MVYDNGALMVGNIDTIIEEIKKELDIYLDMAAIDMNELLKDLEKLKEVNAKIVCINYDNGLNYSIDYWSENDKIKGDDEKWKII